VSERRLTFAFPLSLPLPFLGRVAAAAAAAAAAIHLLHLKAADGGGEEGARGQDDDQRLSASTRASFQKNGRSFASSISGDG